jgi:hypothetical protein
MKKFFLKFFILLFFTISIRSQISLKTNNWFFDCGVKTLIPISQRTESYYSNSPDALIYNYKIVPQISFQNFNLGVRYIKEIFKFDKSYFNFNAGLSINQYNLNLIYKGEWSGGFSSDYFKGEKKLYISNSYLFTNIGLSFDKIIKEKFLLSNQIISNFGFLFFEKYQLKRDGFDISNQKISDRYQNERWFNSEKPIVTFSYSLSGNYFFNDKFAIGLQITFPMICITSYGQNEYFTSLDKQLFLNSGINFIYKLK